MRLLIRYNQTRSHPCEGMQNLLLGGTVGLPKVILVWIVVRSVINLSDYPNSRQPSPLNIIHIRVAHRCDFVSWPQAHFVQLGRNLPVYIRMLMQEIDSGRVEYGNCMNRED